MLSLTDLQPIFEEVAGGVAARTPTENCPVANRLYWVMRIDGELKNGGVAQLVWNLHEQYDYGVLYDALEAIGADSARTIIERAVTYIYDTPRRKDAFFRNGPFAPAKPLRALTDRYYDLSPSVASLLLAHVDASWDVPSFHAIIERLDLSSIRHATLSADDLFTAVADADAGRVASMLAAGIDPSLTDTRHRTLPMIAFGSLSQQPSRVELVEMLVAAGADVNQRTELGSALGQATRSGGQHRYLECLVGLGADLEIPNGRGHTPVFDTVSSPENLHYLIDRGADLHHRGATGLTPLGYALCEYRDCFANANLNDRLPTVRKSIDLLLANGCSLGDTAVRASAREEPQTELSLIAFDAELLDHLLSVSGLDGTPEANNAGGVWTAAHEAAARGCGESIGVLASHGAPLSFVLERSSLERSAFAGSTPIDVADNETTREMLAALGGREGVRRSHDVWITAHGDDDHALAALATLVLDLHGLTATEAAALVAEIPPEPGMTIAWDTDRNLVLYDPLLLAACATLPEADQLAEQCGALGATVVVL